MTITVDACSPAHADGGVISLDAVNEALASANISSLKATINQANENLNSRFHVGCDIIALVRERSTMIDELLGAIWQHIVGDDDDLSLIAVGGYGRGELHPSSDVDLLILLGQDDDAPFAERLSAFLTLLWDVGLEIGHSVRTVNETEAEARKDLTVITNLIESRLLIGSQRLYNDLQILVSKENMWDSKSYFEGKWNEQKKRHAKYDDTAYNLEPNIKGNPGGLRDIQMIGWVVKRHFGADTMMELIRHGFLSKDECKKLMDGQAHLWRIRWALHTLTGRHDDRLLFDHQRALAADLGYEEQDNNLAVEQFMQSYYRTVMELNRLNEMLLNLFQEELLHTDHDATPLNARFQLKHGFIETTNDSVFSHYPFALLEMFLVMQQNPQIKGVRASTIRLVRESLPLIDKNFRKDLRCRALFMEIFRQPLGLTSALRKMNSYGILAAYIPAFANIVGRMQYDLFHAYTVDAHTLFVVRNLRRFSVPKFADEFPLASRVHSELPKQELLYLAGMFHDIAKGRGGDHSELGEKDAEVFCRQHGLSKFDSLLVAWLVRHHLNMSATAQRRDTSDPDVIQEFATEVGDKIHLDYLYLLTVADMRATNGKLWNSWKATLLGGLYDATKRALARGLANPIEKDTLITERKDNALTRLQATALDEQQIARVWDRLDEEYFLRYDAAEMAWHTQLVADQPDSALPIVATRVDPKEANTSVFIHAEDIPGLFARITATLANMGLTVADARILSNQENRSFNTLVILEQDGSSITDADRLAETTFNLRNALTHADANLTVRQRTPRQIKAFDTKTQVVISQDHKRDHTVVEIVAADQPGLLSQLGMAFDHCGIQIHDAKITTIGERVEDIFFITNADNHQVANEDLAKLHEIMIKQVNSLSTT